MAVSSLFLFFLTGLHTFVLFRPVGVVSWAHAQHVKRFSYTKVLGMIRTIRM